MNRRYFLGSALSAGAALRSSALASPNDTVRVGCVGVHGRGGSHINAFSQAANTQVAAICDVDETVLNGRISAVEKATGKRPAAFTDLRKLLEDKTIDAISIASPNHQHTLQTIWACQAGKDVYVEKPCSHNMFEAKQIVAAAQKYNRMVQHGTQQRTTAGPEAVKELRDGLIGDVYMARGLCYKIRDTIGRKPVESPPPGVHYDLWLGPAPERAFTANRFHYNWHWMWDYGNGDLGNQGIHQVDMARWGLGVKYPTKISAIGGHFMFEDDQETPNTLSASFEFDDGGKKKMMTFEVRHWITNHEAGIGERSGAGRGAGRGQAQPPVEGRGAPTTASSPAGGPTVGTIFYGSNGYLAIGSEGTPTYDTFLGREQTLRPSGSYRGNHFANFIDAVRSRKHSDLNGPIEEGAISTTLVHLANISYRLGRTLHFDAASYSCTGDAEANKMFTRNYRRPYVVPEKV